MRRGHIHLLGGSCGWTLSLLRASAGESSAGGPLRSFLRGSICVRAKSSNQGPRCTCLTQDVASATLNRWKLMSHCWGQDAHLWTGRTLVVQVLGLAGTDCTEGGAGSGAAQSWPCPRACATARGSSSCHACAWPDLPPYHTRRARLHHWSKVAVIMSAALPARCCEGLV